MLKLITTKSIIAYAKCPYKAYLLQWTDEKGIRHEYEQIIQKKKIDNQTRYINMHKTQGKKFSQFFIVSIIGMLINVTTATIVITYLQTPITNILGISLLESKQLWVTISALTGTAVGLLWNFVGYKFIVFKK